MSRNTVLQLIAAVITIAILIVLHQWLDWALSMTSTDFMVGVMVGMALILAVWIYEDRKERRSRTAGSAPPAEEQGTRHTIDL